MNFETTTVDLLRHGDVAGGKLLLGHSDVPLSELGWSQLRGLVDDRTPPWEFIVTSPLERCAAFARELAVRFSLELDFNDGFKEMNFGAWEGRAIEELYHEQGARLQAFWNDPTENPAPAGEPYQAFEERVSRAWEGLLNDRRGQHCLLIAHGGTIRMILKQILHFPGRALFQIEVPYACLTRIAQHDGTAPRLVFHGGVL
jgi:alpha-ribazole phosphatase/probable phosphoglycerate mutase